MRTDVLRYAKLGWVVLPCWPKSKRAMWRWTSGSANQRIIQAWSRCWPNANWALVCGPGSGVAVIDIDGAVGEHSLDQLTKAYGALPLAPMAISGGVSGRHLYFRWPEGRELRNGVLGVDLEFRGDKLLVMVPPSVHPETNQRYRWQIGYSPFELELPGLPEWICERMAPKPIAARTAVDAPGTTEAYFRAAIARELADLAGAPPGRRNSTLNDAAWSLLRFAADGKITPGGLVNSLMSAAKECGLDEREAWLTIRSAARARGVRLG